MVAYQTTKERKLEKARSIELVKLRKRIFSGDFRSEKMEPLKDNDEVEKVSQAQHKRKNV